MSPEEPATIEDIFELPEYSQKRMFKFRMTLCNFFIAVAIAACPKEERDDLKGMFLGFLIGKDFSDAE